MNKKKNRFVLGFVFGMVAMLVVVVSVGAGVYISHYNGANISVYEDTKDKVNDIEKFIDYYYLDEVDDKNLEEGVYKGLLAGLGDPYSAYYTAEEYKQLMEEASGSYSGLGMVVTQNAETGVITILKVFDNAPAAEVGIKNGDILYKVEGKEVTGENLNTVVSEMKGKEGTKVKVTVYRQEEDKYIDFTVTRRAVDVPTVEYKMLDKKNKIGYIQITEFEEVTYNQFVEAVKALKKQKVKGIVFDLRDNPGGLYNIVCDILDDILPEGTLVYTKDKYGYEEKQTSDAKCIDMPIVVLQNGNSASASEIFAGAIQDFGAGKIIGTQSFGKGIVQTIRRLDDGSAVKLTIQNYYTPTGKNIHGKGITPDIVVEEDTTSKEDKQLKTATDTMKSLIK